MRVLKGLAVKLSVCAGTAVSAGQCGYDYCWGAVGIGDGGAWGYSYGQVSEEAAVEALQGACEWDCDNVHTFYNTCGAMAEGTSGNWGFGYASSRDAAEDTALDYCSDHGGGCAVRVWACSP